MGEAIRWVRQEDPYGCGAAAVAMLTGKTYADVKADSALFEYLTAQLNKEPLTW